MNARDKPAGWAGGARSGVGLAVAAALCLAASAAPGGARAQDPVGERPEDARRYAACMELARKDAKRAQATASAWHATGGGPPAMHCLSVALLSLGYYEQAARNLEALASGDHKLSAALRGDLLGQAGNAWSIAGDPERAYRAQSAALKLKPDDVDLLIDRGITLASTARYWDALDDLNRALDLAPRRVDALVFRAAAYRKLDSLELAEENVRRALELAPEDPNALLERGAIAEQKGDRDSARADWLHVLDLTSDGALAEAARAGLERIDVNPR